jgi:hypothetical protein
MVLFEEQGAGKQANDDDDNNDDNGHNWELHAHS